MKKYYFNGKEVDKNSLENLMPLLEELGIVDSKEVVFIPKDTCYYITNIAKKLSKTYDEALSFMRDIIALNKSNAISILLKEMSRDLDRQYNKSITLYPYFYVFNFLNYSVVKVNKEQISNNYNYTSFAYFRTEKEADKALYIALNIIDDIKKTVANKDGK